MKKILIAALLSLAPLLFADEMLYVDDLTAKEAAAMIQAEGAVLIDVRDPVEFLYTGHAVGAVNIPVFFVRIDLPPLDTRLKIAALEEKKKEAIHVKKTYKPIMDENKNFLEDVKKLTKGDLDRPLIVICHSGNRSVFAANRLAKNGFENVYNVEGGLIFGWIPAGLPAGGQ
jgi:rhodanese-related sulfurtransferase